MRAVRCVVRALGALLAVSATVPGLVLALPPASAATSATAVTSASVVTSASAAASRQQPLAISITGMTPRFAVKGATIRLSGTLANHTGSAVTGITVQAYTSSSVVPTRDALSTFAAGGSDPSQLTPAGEPQVKGSVGNGETVHWTASFSADEFYDQFGAFPVRVQATTPDGQYTADASTGLPYWPSGSASQPARLQTAWIWPLVDQPQQGACSQTLATTELSRSVAGGGRLSALLGAGAAWSQRDDLTWDIDPALLSDVSVMTRPYFTGGNVCSGRFPQQPSQAATSWLAKLATTTAGAPAFATPYADVDVAALSHAGMNASLLSAYQLGDSVAGQLLPKTFGADGAGGAGTQVLKAAWPADGQADGTVLASLANEGGVSTVVLSSSGELPSATPGRDNALSKTTTATGTPMAALLADSGLTSLLATASPTATPSGQFALTQDFLAQTAMISNEAPHLGRSLVIAPPASWKPSAAEAQALLAIAHDDAPWLQSASLSGLAAKTASLPARAPLAKQAGPAGLRPGYVDSLREVNASLSLFKGMLYKPSATLTSTLDGAMAGTESSAWRGGGSAGGWLATTQLQRYLHASTHDVKIIPIPKVLLAGSSGKTPVSVNNALTVPVQVKVTASTPPGSLLQVGSYNPLVVVPAGKTKTVSLPLSSAAIGTSTVQLQLATQDGSPLSWTARSLSIDVTRVGRFLLTIIGGALGLLVLTSVYRLRRKRLASARAGGSGDDKADAGGAG
jgi:Family of unknown function (DUF6049)